MILRTENAPASPADETRETSVSNSAYLAIAAMAVLVYWLPRLFRGFWSDEAFAYWVGRKGFAHALANTLICPTQSIVYSHIAALFAVDGPYKEALLRIPSVLGVLAAAWLVVKLTDQIAGAGAGILALVPFVCSGAIVQTATDARPYALALASVLASFASLRDWVQRGKTKSLAIYCVSSVLVVYFQYLFAFIFLVQAVYVAAARRNGRTFSWKPLICASATILALMAPLGWLFNTIRNEAHASRSAWKPAIADFLSIYPSHALCVVAAGLALYWILHSEWFGRLPRLEKDDAVLLVAWAVLGPAVLFAAARSTPYAFFATRYLLYALLPCFILLAWAVQAVQDARARLALIAAIAINALLVIPWMKDAEWRTPLAISQKITDASAPLLLTSGFTDSADADLRGEPKANSFLFAPLAAYPVRNPIIPVPYFIDGAAARLIETEVERAAPAHPRFCLLAPGASDAMDILPGWFRDHGYRSSQQDSGGYKIILFERVSR